MKKMTLTLSLALLAAAAFSEEVLRTIPWASPPAQADGVTVELAPAETPGGHASLRITGTAVEGATVTLLTIDQPGITSFTYALRGMVRHSDVEGKGYLQTWNCFPGGKKHFSRTLATAGPTRHLQGTSKWRPFVLPFHITGEKQLPERIELSLVLPGRGTVWLGPLELVEFEKGENALTLPGQWWDDRCGGLIGGLAGVLLGICGALIGTLSSKGKGRSLVFGLVSAMTLAGVAALVLGVVAVLMKQPYAVYFPLLLLGLLATTIPLNLVHVLRRRYQELELRKMDALDA